MKKKLLISTRSILVRDMILTRKGGPHVTHHKDDWWDEEEELESLEDDEDDQ